MNVIDAIRNRYAVRDYRKRDVEEEKLQQVLEAARWAPSAHNRQEWQFVVVRNSTTRRRLAEASHNQRFVGQAPVVIAVCSTEPNHVMPCGQVAYPIELAIATDHMALEAVEEGLGTCWVGDFDERKVKRILNIPEQIRVVILLPLGYPNGSISSSLAKKRRQLREIVKYEQWTKT